MSKKFGLIILVLLALSLSACTLSGSTAPTATPLKRNNNKVQASPTVGQMNVVEAAATGTAAALAGAPSDSTPAPVIVGATVTATPSAGLPTVTGNAPTALPPQPTVQTARPATYTLKQGEFAYCLARRFNVDPDDLLSLNGLVDSEILTPGITLKIPTSGSFPGARALKQHPATYIVQTDDTIYSIACLYGDVDPANIALVNNLAVPYNLTTGAQIRIP